jgi:hypothetical protein
MIQIVQLHKITCDGCGATHSLEEDNLRNLLNLKGWYRLAVVSKDAQCFPSFTATHHACGEDCASTVMLVLLRGTLTNTSCVVVATGDGK